MSTATANRRSAEVRAARKSLKARIANGEVAVVGVLLDPPDEARTMRVETLLAAQRRCGPQQIWKTCTRARVSPYATLGSMSTAERRRLLATLGWRAGRKGPDPAVSRERRRELAGDALALMRRRYAEPWTLTTLSAELGWSKSTVCQALAESGTTFVDALTRTRVAAAAALLRRDGWVGQDALAKKVGLSRTTLVTGFRRYLQTTPAAYHRLHRARGG